MKYSVFKEEFQLNGILTRHKISHAMWLRFCFMERQLLWSRRLNATMVCQAFGSSLAVVQSEITRYKEIYRRLRDTSPLRAYNPKLKYHRPAESFSPIFLSDDTFHWSQIEDYEAIDTTLATEMPMLARRHSLEKLAIILSGIEHKRSFEVNIASMNHPKGAWRLISPVGIACVHNRVHVRAFCWAYNDYRDFLIGRFLSKPFLRRPGMDVEMMGSYPKFEQFKGDPPVKDGAWTDQVTLNLIPNPNLSDDQQELIASDYILGPLPNRKLLQIRKSLVQYFLIDNRLPATDLEFEAAKNKPKVWPVLALISGSDIPAHKLGF